jgi:hypothetical protein
MDSGKIEPRRIARSAGFARLIRNGTLGCRGMHPHLCAMLAWKTAVAFANDPHAFHLEAHFKKKPVDLIERKGFSEVEAQIEYLADGTDFFRCKANLVPEMVENYF